MLLQLKNTEESFSKKRSSSSRDEGMEPLGVVEKDNRLVESGLAIYCYPSYFLRKLETLRLILLDSVMKILDKSPFGHFFQLRTYYKMEKDLIVELLNIHDMDHDLFVIGGEEYKFSSEDLCLMLGLFISGIEIDFVTHSLSCEL